MNNDTERYADKVAKLIAKAERAATEAEADAFYAKAQDLMTKWGIEEAMLAAAGKGDVDEIAHESRIVKRSSFFKAYVHLWAGIAKANNVKILQRGQAWGKLAGVELIGFKSDIDRTEMLYTSLLLHLTKERNKQCPDEIKGTKGHAKWVNSFSLGYALRIGRRLQEQKDRTEKDAVKEDATGDLLPALRSRTDQVDAYYDSLSKSKARQSNMSVDGSGYDAGKSTADRADLGNTRVGEERSQISR